MKQCESGNYFLHTVLFINNGSVNISSPHAENNLSKENFYMNSF